MTSGGPKTDSRWLALIVLCAGMLMIVLDQTIVNVALPAIEEDLKFGQAGLAWVVNAYLIAYGGLLLLAGRLGDLIGHKKVFLIGLGVFTVASLLCGVSVSSEMLIVSRFVQGAGGALEHRRRTVSAHSPTADREFRAGRGERTRRYAACVCRHQVAVSLAGEWR